MQGCKARSVLDYGCGKRHLEKGLRQVFNGAPVCPIINYDPGLDMLGKQPCDVVACLDVLEHIEPELLDNVLQDLRAMTKKVGFFTIATRPAKKTLSDGRNAHLIQEPYTWWLPKLWSIFKVEAFQDFEGREFLVIVK